MENLRLIELLRVAYRHDSTLGVLIDSGTDENRDSEGEPFAVTCEEVWKDNLPQISCIPHGEYICQRVNSPKFGSTFQIMDVPGRSHILFHKGNTTADTLGCVLVAESYERINGVVGVAQSDKGYKELMSRLSDVDRFRLIITEA